MAASILQQTVENYFKTRFLFNVQLFMTIFATVYFRSVCLRPDIGGDDRQRLAAEIAGLLRL